MTGADVRRFGVELGLDAVGVARAEPYERTEREIRDRSTAAGYAPVEPLDVLAAMASGSGVRDFMVDLVREVREAGHRTGIVTNNVAEFREFWRPMLPLDELFDDVVDSSEVGVRKPNSEIYRLACERLGVEPASSTTTRAT